MRKVNAMGRRWRGPAAGSIVVAVACWAAAGRAMKHSHSAIGCPADSASSRDAVCANRVDGSGRMMASDAIMPPRGLPFHAPFNARPAANGARTPESYESKLTVHGPIVKTDKIGAARRDESPHGQ